MMIEIMTLNVMTLNGEAWTYDKYTRVGRKPREGREMHLKDIQIAKQNMDAELTQIVQEFERETGLRVRIIHVAVDFDSEVNGEYTKTKAVETTVNL